MKLSALVLVPLAAAAPTSPEASAAPETSAADALSRSLLSPLGNNYCSPTGQESCNLWLKTIWGKGAQASEYSRSWKVFDYGCSQIGGADSVPDVKNYSLYSMLPYSIELHLDNYWAFTGYFDYAGRRTDLGLGYCEDCSTSQWNAQCCRVAFRCH